MFTAIFVVLVIMGLSWVGMKWMYPRDHRKATCDRSQARVLSCERVIFAIIPWQSGEGL